MAVDRKTLSEQHSSLEESAEVLSAAIAITPPDMEALAKAKWQLGYRLALHLAQEDRHVYPVLKTHVNPRIAQLAILFEREMGDLDQRFRDYIAQWPTSRVETEWPAFTRETRLLLAALAQRIRREEQELYLLLDETA